MPKETLEAIRASRENEKQILDARQSRVSDQYRIDWIARTEEVDNLYAGRIDVVFPDETAEEKAPTVMNIVQVGADETARLVAETQPQLRSEARGTDQEQVDAAYLRESAHNTMWLQNEGEDVIVPQLGYDLALTGLAFLACSPAQDFSEFPIATVLDPRGCYPTWGAQNRLTSLMVTTRRHGYELDDVLAEFNLQKSDVFNVNELAQMFEFEVIDLYGPQNVKRYIALTRQNESKPYAAADMGVTWDHQLGFVPVAYGRLPTGDRNYRGIFDQIKGIFRSQNQIFQLQIDYADQEVYAPWFFYDVENDTITDIGPDTRFRGRSPESKAMRVSPAGSNPQLFAILEYLERQARGGAAYPAQRNAEVSQSIASASFIHASLGQMVTQIKFVQKQVAFLRRQWHYIAAHVDRDFGPEGARPLLFASGKEFEYDPKTVFAKASDCRVKVLYGAGAGLDALNAKAAIAQDVSLGVISKEDAMEANPAIYDVPGTKQRIEKEQIEGALLQKAVNDPSATFATVVRMAVRMKQGRSLLEMAEEIVAIEEKAEAEAARETAGDRMGDMTGQEPGNAPTAEQFAAGAQAPPTAAPAAEANVIGPPTAQVILRNPTGGG